jgi:hypothetical protein
MAGHGITALSGVIKAQPPSVNRPLVGEAVAQLVGEGGSTPASRALMMTRLLMRGSSC